MRIFAGYFWVVSILLLITVNCSKENNFEFNNVESITGRPVEDITIHSSGNVYLSVIDTLLIIVKAEEPFLQIYSTNTPVSELNAESWQTKVQVFDWNGNPVKEFRFADGRPVRSFAVDSIHNRIYAYDPVNPVYNLVLYEFSM